MLSIFYNSTYAKVINYGTNNITIHPEDFFQKYGNLLRYGYRLIQQVAQTL